MQKNILVIMFLGLVFQLKSQSLSIFDIDTTSFPIMKAKFYGFDDKGNQIRPNVGDLAITENGQSRVISNVSCAAPKPAVTLSTVLLIDVSKSMQDGFPKIDLVKYGAKRWIELLKAPKSETAIVTFSNYSFIDRDFTKDKKKLYEVIDLINLSNGTNYTEGFLNQSCGAISVASTGKYKREILLISDGSSGDINKVNQILDSAKINNITINIIMLEPWITPLLRQICEKTNGKYFVGVSSKEKMDKSILYLSSIRQFNEPCNLEWVSDYYCVNQPIKVELNYPNLSLKEETFYKLPNKAIAELEINPRYILFENIKLGTTKDSIIKITAKNADFFIKNIQSSNSNYTIKPTTFNLKENQEIELTLSYSPKDSSYSHAKFIIENDLCPTTMYSVGYYWNKPPIIQTLKLTFPNGGETLVVGTDTLITWEGIPENEYVSLEYSTDNGKNWVKIADSCTGLKYLWKIVPQLLSNKNYLVRVSQYGSDYSETTPPYIEWEKSFGGSKDDLGASIYQTSDGGFILTGFESSIDGDITENKGMIDIWVIKLDDHGSIMWQKTFGGELNDRAFKIFETKDGGYILNGTTESSIGDMPKTHGKYDMCWIKLDKNGNKEWSNTFGGPSYDYGWDCVETMDGGFILAGELYIPIIGGDSLKAQIIKLDKSGTIEWSRTYGGNGPAIATSIKQKPNGDYIFAGGSLSSGGDTERNIGNGDYWIVKLDNYGNVIWKKNYGGTGLDYAKSLQLTVDGGEVVTGYTHSNEGDVSGLKGIHDCWIVKFDDFGNLEWQRNIGGSNYDQSYSICETMDKGFLVTSSSMSNDVDVTGNKGDYDFWISKLDYYGNLKWQKSIGGSKYDFAFSGIQCTNGSYIIAGTTLSNDGDVSFNHGMKDAYVVKLSSDIKIIQQDISDATFTISMPNVSSSDLDMKKCIITSSKDSVIFDYVKNIGSFKCRIDTIYIRGEDANSFKLTSGLPPYILESGKSKNIGIIFSPYKIGLHHAEIVIKTQYNEIIQNIIGEGFSPNLTLSTNMLDFGIVEIGKEKVFQDTILLTNVSNSSIKIDNVRQLGPDSSQFEIISGDGPFVLDGFSSRKLSIKFKPNSFGRTSGQISFDFEGGSFNLVTSLFGVGIGGKLLIPDDSAYPGEKRNLKLIYSNSSYGALNSLASSFEADLRFQKTILEVLGNNDSNILNDSIYLKINGIIDNKNELATIPILAGLGSVEESMIQIDDIVLYDNFGNPIDYNFDKIPGKFKILGVCHSGGARLINPVGDVKLSLISPNPVENIGKLEVETIETGYTEIYIVNLLGDKIADIFCGNLSNGKMTIPVNTKDLYNGSYLIILKTPSVIKSLKMEIIK